MHPHDPHQGPPRWQQGRPYQQPPYHPNDPHQSPPQERQSNNVLCLLGFILAVLGLVVWRIPVFDFILAAAGVVLSSIALARHEIKGLSIAGICVGGVGALLGLFWSVALIISVGTTYT